MGTVYVGSGKEFGNYGDINISICLDDLPEEFRTVSKNGKTYVKLVVSKRKEPGKYGETHGVKINDWKPQAEAVQEKTSSPAHNSKPPVQASQGHLFDDSTLAEEEIPF